MRQVTTETGITSDEDYVVLPGGVYKGQGGGLVPVHHFTAEQQSLYRQARYCDLDCARGTITFYIREE